jgi:hypothetical protein
MDVDLDEGHIPDAAEAVNLPGLDDENIPGAGFEFLSVHGIQAAAFPQKLDFIVGVPVGSGTAAR